MKGQVVFSGDHQELVSENDEDRDGLGGAKVGLDGIVFLKARLSAQALGLFSL